MTSAYAAPYWPATLATTRLELRPVVSSDVPAIARLWTDAEVRRYLGGPVAEDVVRLRGQRCVGATGVFSVVRRKDDCLLGLVLVEPDARDGRTEVSYQFLPEHWGRGYAREAVAAAVSWASAEVTSKVPGVVAVTQEANERSRQLLDALGGVLVGRFEEWGAPQVMYRFT
ncbi:GNAT family N-acetyltransferase [Streptomyces sp. NPDC002187]|uniref:GNAT family N-acetyltransferase n=1 Tax=Streptomyces sp. NPDC002187 TaxID=3364637 RepID=UPI0036A74A10